jgi:phospholipid/cholesterol/gamma-HCH transport system ATP-binding protein
VTGPGEKAPTSAEAEDSRIEAELDAAVLPVEVRGLVSRYGENLIHDGVDLKVKRGEVLGVVGGSGAGKSVLLNTIIGLKQPDGGEVRIFGQNTDHVGRRKWAAIERRWGVLFQSGALFTNLTVKENVAAPMLEHTKLSKSDISELAELKIALSGLPSTAGALKPSELSGGMRKRAALARALALDPELLFLDEPTAGLDPIGAASFDQLIGDLSDTLGLTVFMITHDLDTLYSITDRVAVLADKKVVAVAPVAELEQSDHPWIKEYFLGPRGRSAHAAVEKAG